MNGSERVLLVGGGAREHALARALRRSALLEELIAAPGNAGIAAEARSVAAPADDVAGLRDVARHERITLAIVGPEAPLCAGLADALREDGVAVFGPGAASARLEGSKAFSKEFMRRHGVPTADFRVFDDADEAERYVREAGRPLVVKADGLAAGKGVVVAFETAEAIEAVDAMMRKRAFGAAGARVVIEEVLPGEEISFHVLVSPAGTWELGGAQDHKRVGDGDSGPNTGGMGAYAPVPVLDDALLARIREEIVGRTIAGLRADGMDYRGVLFFGLMVHGGAPRLLEYNVRFGDPECAVLLARQGGDVLAALRDVARGESPSTLDRDPRGAAIAVVVAAHGYPAAPRLGDTIEGVADAMRVPGVEVLHAGTRRAASGALVSAGGRVLTVTATGSDLDDAATQAYRAVDSVRFDGAHARRDIGWRARKR